MPLPDHLERLARQCEITPFKSSGPGGQKKNKTESSVRVKHVRTGLTRIATESRSQSRNRALALERVWEELKRRARRPRRRIATRPTVAAVENRLAAKRQASALKRERRKPEEE